MYSLPTISDFCATWLLGGRDRPPVDRLLTPKSEMLGSESWKDCLPSTDFSCTFSTLSTLKCCHSTMRCITGDECGLIKECTPSLLPKNGVTTTKEGIRRLEALENASRRRGVVGLAWTEPDAQFASLHMNGVIELWNCHSSYQRTLRIPNVFAGDDEKPSRPLGLGRFGHQNRNFLCACNGRGRVVVLSPDEELPEHPIVSSFSVFDKKQEDVLVTAMAVNGSRVAVGGKDRDVVLCDLHTTKQVWKAKNLPPNPQTLLQPQVWPTAICFLQNNIVAAGSAHRQVRVYDVRTDQRRPIAVTPDNRIQHRVTSLCPLDANQLAVADAAGFVLALELRKMDLAGRFVGPVGSVRQLVRQETRMAVVGLDRMLRIYDTTTRKQLHCFYLKQRLNCVLVRGEEMHRAEERDALDLEDVVGDYVDSDLEETLQDESGTSDSNDDSDSGILHNESQANQSKEDDEKDVDEFDLVRKKQRR